MDAKDNALAVADKLSLPVGQRSLMSLSHSQKL